MPSTSVKPWEGVRDQLFRLNPQLEEIWNNRPQGGYTGDFQVTGPNADIFRALNLTRGNADQFLGAGNTYRNLSEQAAGRLDRTGRTLGNEVWNLGRDTRTALDPMRADASQSRIYADQMAGRAGTFDSYARNVGQNVGQMQNLGGQIAGRTGTYDQLARGVGSTIGQFNNIGNTLGGLAGQTSGYGNRVAGLSQQPINIGNSMAGRGGQLYNAGQGALNQGQNVFNQGIGVANSQFNLGPLSAQAQQAGRATGTALGTLERTAAGGFTGPTPELRGAINAAFDPVVQQYQRNIVPGLDSAAISGGAYGGSRNGIAQGVAAGDLTRNLANTGATMSYNNLMAERGRQQEAALSLPSQYTNLGNFDTSRALAQEQGQGMRTSRGLAQAGMGQAQMGLGGQLYGAAAGQEQARAGMYGQAGNMLGQAGQLQQGAGALYGQQGNMYNLGNQARALQGDLTSAGGQNLMNAGGMYNMANQGIGQQGQLTGMGVNALGQAGAMRGQSSQILGNYGTSMGNVGNMYNLGNNMYNTGIQSGLNTYAGGVTGGYNMNMAPIQGIAGVGQTMQGYDQAAITNAIQQQQERERSPWAGLDQYIGGLSASGGYPHTQQGGGSGGLGGILQGGLGLGLGIAGIGSMLGWRPFGGAPQQGPQPGVNGWNPWGAGW